MIDPTRQYQSRTTMILSAGAAAVAFETVALTRVAVVTIAPCRVAIRLNAAWGASPVLRMAGHQTFSQVHASSY